MNLISQYLVWELLSQQKQEDCPDEQKILDWHNTSMLASSDYEEEDTIFVNHIVNKRKAF